MRLPLLTRRAAPLLLLAATSGLHAQQDPRGRKYVPPPPTGHITVVVTKGLNHKPVENAAVIFHTMHNGHDDGNLEVKTNEDGKVSIDVIPIGESVRLQIIKTGFQTYGEDFTLDTPTRDFAIALHAPTHQVSTYDKPATPADGAAAPAPPPQ